LRVFLAWPALLRRDKTAAGIAAAFAKPKILSNAAFPNYFTGSKSWASKPPLASRQRIIKKARSKWRAFKCIGGSFDRFDTLR
jgi:hypothetical protein